MQTTVLEGVELPDEFVFAAGEDFTSGVTTVSTAATAVANVDSVPTGTIVQGVPGEEHGEVMTVAEIPPGTLYLENNGDVSVLASATSTGADGEDGHGPAQAFATVADAVSQIIEAPIDGVAATARNTGSLAVGAEATALGGFAPGFGEDNFAARAIADVTGGFHQEASLAENTDGTATVTSTNTGSFVVYSDATASAIDDAIAEATTREAVYMRASGNGASDATTQTTLTNSGRLDFSATALGISTDGNATALAEAGGGEHGLMHLRARTNGVGEDSSTVTMVNQAAGDLFVAATSTAIAEGLATAEARGGNAFSGDEEDKGGGLVMKAQASGADDGDVAVSLTNAGEMRFAYISSATSTGVPVIVDDDDAMVPLAVEFGANAWSIVNGAIHQTIEAGGPESFLGRSGTISLTNQAGGVLALTASASATSETRAWAQARIGAAVYQQAEMTGSAAASFTNAGAFLATA